MSSSFQWHGPEAKAHVEAIYRRQLTAACIVLRDRAKELISEPAPPPSLPGEPPHKRTGRGRASVAYEVSGLVGRVGTNVKYLRWLELGTLRVAARPWLRRALRESQAQITAIFARGPQ